jgi:hypothetical protein
MTASSRSPGVLPFQPEPLDSAVTYRMDRAGVTWSVVLRHWDASFVRGCHRCPIGFCRTFPVGDTAIVYCLVDVRGTVAPEDAASLRLMEDGRGRVRAVDLGLQGLGRR